MIEWQSYGSQYNEMYFVIAVSSLSGKYTRLCIYRLLICLYAYMQNEDNALQVTLSTLKYELKTHTMK